jgi:hypothetical protein
VEKLGGLAGGKKAVARQEHPAGLISAEQALERGAPAGFVKPRYQELTEDILAGKCHD